MVIEHDIAMQRQVATFDLTLRDLMSRISACGAGPDTTEGLLAKRYLPTGFGLHWMSSR